MAKIPHVKPNDIIEAAHINSIVDELGSTTEALNSVQTVTENLNILSDAPMGAFANLRRTTEPPHGVVITEMRQGVSMINFNQSVFYGHFSTSPIMRVVRVTPVSPVSPVSPSTPASSKAFRLTIPTSLRNKEFVLSFHMGHLGGTNNFVNVSQENGSRGAFPDVSYSESSNTVTFDRIINPRGSSWLDFHTSSSARIDILFYEHVLSSAPVSGVFSSIEEIPVVLSTNRNKIEIQTSFGAIPMPYRTTGGFRQFLHNFSNTPTERQPYGLNTRTIVQLPSPPIYQTALALGPHSILIGNSINQGLSNGNVGVLAIGRGTVQTHVGSAIISTNNELRWAHSTANNQFLLGRPDMTVSGFSTFSNISDERDKTDVSPLKYNALEFVNKLIPRNYRMDYRQNYMAYIEITNDEYAKLDPYTKQHRIEMYETQILGDGDNTIECLVNERIATYLIDKLPNDRSRRKAGKTLVVSSMVKANELYYKTYGEYLHLDTDGQEVKDNKHTYDEVNNDKSTKYGSTVIFQIVQLDSDGSKAGVRYHSGFLAQEVEKTANDMGFDFTGVQYNAHHKEIQKDPLTGEEVSIACGDDLYMMSYSDFIAPLVGAVQQLTNQNKNLEERLAKLESAMP